MTSDDLGWAHTRAEWEQAWNQVRHFETMRGQWLGFFFTVVLGVTAIAGPKLDASNSKSVLVIALLALILELWSAALYLAVARLNEVQRYNDQIIFAIREATMSSPPAAVDLARYTYPPGPPRRGRLGALASTKKASELVLLVGVFLFTAALLGDVTRAATFSRISDAALAVSALACGIGVCIAGFCVWARRTS
ncbi:MAG TPA: hypothetical protein VK721_02435 [Solirubrobacteraceae bacterium]|jgi:hypothetical protein|nr:hypothetical protein [Solirubrobacteraceae bacterium]